MRCRKCKCEMPFDISLGITYDCIFCDGTQVPTAEDYLSNSSLTVANEIRPAQIHLTKLVDTSFQTPQVLMIEAGTGTGKSLSYLLPAILSGKRTIVSTAKKSLQSQLIEKDLPYLQSKLSSAGITFKYAPAYGKNNYVCEKNVKKQNKGAKFKNGWEWFFTHAPTARWDEAQLALDKYKSTTKSKRAVKLPVYNSTLSAEDCTGSACPLAASCKYMEAKRAVDQANIVVTNHWLVGFHLRLKKEMAFELLGQIDYLIVDEAHKFEDGIRDAFTHEIRENALQNIVSSFEEDSGTDLEFPDKAQLTAAWASLFKKVKPFGDTSIGADTMGHEGTHLQKVVAQTLAKFTDPKYIAQVLGCNSDHAKALAGQDNTRVVPLDESQSQAHIAMYNARKKLESINQALISVYEDTTNRVCYVENTGFYCAIRIAPIDIAPFMHSAHEEINSTSYVSATLAINNTMDVFSRRTGVSKCPPSKVVSARFGSAFDLDKQALLYLSKSVPIPTRKDSEVQAYRSALADEIRELSHAIKGNTFVLFTARDEMKDVYERLSPVSNHPILIQDKISAAELLTQYRNTPNAILFGLKSFWEGVDVPGNKLSLVIITKLPFPGKNDPIVEARRAKAGNEWFNKVDLPDMILDLRQGVGRLIRTKQDRGVIAILDQRLLTKRYRTQVINSLGITRVTTNIERVKKGLNVLANVP